MTHTYAEVALAPALYDQLAAALRAAGVDQAFDRDGRIDLHGLAAVKAPQGCAHKNTITGWDILTCKDCGFIRTDGNNEAWGRARFRWFPSRTAAETYRDFGAYPGMTEEPRNG